MIRILLVGTGGMARAHAGAFAEIDGAAIVAAVDTDPNRLQAFITERNIPRGFASVDHALDWGEFDAVCNATPDAVHHQVAMPLLAAGKHMLCEKPLATNHADAVEMADLILREGEGKINFHPFAKRSAGLAVLRAPDVPGVLFESGFVTNDQDLAKLMSKQGREAYVDTLERAIRVYLARRAEP